MRHHPWATVLIILGTAGGAGSAGACAIGSQADRARGDTAGVEHAPSAASAWNAASSGAAATAGDPEGTPPPGEHEGEAPASASSPMPSPRPPGSAAPDTGAPDDAAGPLFPPGFFDAGPTDGGHA